MVVVKLDGISVGILVGILVGEFFNSIVHTSTCKQTLARWGVGFIRIRSCGFLEWGAQYAFVL